jgi:hypothetical protein
MELQEMNFEFIIQLPEEIDIQDFDTRPASASNMYEWLLSLPSIMPSVANAMFYAPKNFKVKSEVAIQFLPHYPKCARRVERQ